jgi:hypothetical protein
MSGGLRFRQANGAFLALLIGRPEYRKQLAVLASIECHNNDQLRHFPFG